MDLPWPINDAFMEGVRGDKRENPYVAGLKSGIQESLSEFVCNRYCVSVEFYKCVGIPLWKTKMETLRL